jgi:peptidyl-prolyl cis-trans isomerase D
MLDGMRKAAQGGIGRFIMAVVMGLIIVSFVIWGVGDMFRGLVADKIASVGSASVTVSEFHNEWQDLVYQYQRQSKGAFTAAQAHAVGLDAQLLTRLIDDAALDERAKSLGLAMSYETIADAARNDPKLHDASGQFSRALFDQALRNSGLTERAFFEKQRGIYLRQQLEHALVDGLGAPKPLVEALAAADAQTRGIDYLVLPPSAAGEIAAPSAQALQSYYDDRKSSYRAPELRAFDILLVSPAALAKPAEVSDDDAKAVYEKQKDSRFATPEKRDVQQIVFPTEAEAAEGSAKIKSGTSFDDLAKDRKLSQSDLDLGEITKADIFDPAIGDAAFALNEGAVSDVVKGKFGYLLLRVVKIVPGSVKPFEAVAAEIKQSIATERAASDVQGLHDKIEDARVSGKSLSEAGQSVGLNTTAVPSVDAQGVDAKGQKIDVPEKSALLRAVFASDIGADDAPLNTHDKGYLWFAVTKVDPAREKSFDEVKDEVEKAWRQDEIAKALSAKAADLVKQIDAGASVADLAKGLSLEVKSATGLTRKSGGDLPQGVAVAAFSVADDKGGSAQTPDGRLVFKVVKDETPPFDPSAPGVKATTDKLVEGLQSGILEQYLDQLKHQLGVKINQNALQLAEGS